MSLMYAQLGMKAVEAFGGYSAEKHSAKMEAISRNYQQRMAAISAALQLNVQTDNEIAVADAAKRASVALGTDSLRDSASAAAMAAASGVAGGSVSGVMRGIMRSKLRATETLRMKMQDQAKANANTRSNIAFQRIMGKDISPIGRPSAASALLGFAASGLDIWDSHQPEGNKIVDAMSKWGR